MNCSRLSRLFDPATIEFSWVSYHPFRCISVSNRSTRLFSVVDHFGIDAPDDLKPPKHNNLDDTLRGIVLVGELDSLQIPGSDVLVALLPPHANIGSVNYSETVVYWQECFWMPVASSRPNAASIYSHVYSSQLSGQQFFELLYKVEVSDISQCVI